MRSINPALRATATVAIVAAFSAGIVGTAQAGVQAKGKPGGGTTVVVTTTTSLSPSAIKAVHDRICPTVVDYSTCAGITVTVADFGATSWIASSSPANKTVSYNSHFQMSDAGWAQTVSHEIGGHHDAWNELVAKGGAAQAWTDYYDLDYFGQQWAQARYLAVKGTTRSFTLTEGKETYLDCVGPVSHGYTGNYLTNRGITGITAQTQFCQGAATVMSDSLTKARPA